MPVLTTVITHATGDVYPASDWNTYNRDNVNYLIAAGADLASAATIIPTNEFHGVTGLATIDNISPAAPIAGQRVRLLIKGGPLLVRHNIGNIATRSQKNIVARTGDVLNFVYDGVTYWRQIDADWSSIRGNVTLSGGIGQGAGFTPSRLSAGSYLVTFTTPFGVPPVVSATINIGTGFGYRLIVFNVAATGFNVDTFDGSGTINDSGFYFVAEDANA